MNRLEHRKNIDILLSYIVPIKIKNNLIRIGSQYDGGYVISDDIDTNDILLSFGIGDNIDFEKNISSYLKQILMYDGTIIGVENIPSNSVFFNKNIYVSEDLDNAIYDAKSETNNFIVKIDVEEDEWHILDKIKKETLQRFKQIIVEFHNFDKRLDSYAFDIDNNNNSKYLLAKSIFEKIKNTHEPIHIHANNFGKLHIIANQVIPEVFEITYLRKDLVKYEENSNTLSLDSPNNPNFPEIKWFPNV